jgi:integrase
MLRSSSQSEPLKDELRPPCLKEDPVFLEDPVMRLSDFFETIYSPLRLLNRSPRTKTLFRYSIRLFGQTLGRPAELSDLSDLTVARHLERLIEERRAPAGVNKERRQLVALWNLAARKRLVDEFPSISTVREPERLPEAWSMEELWRLRIACNMEPGTIAGVPAGRWWSALHLVLYSTGERVSAVLDTRWSDVSGASVVFPAESRKGKRKPLLATLSPEAVEALERIRLPERELVFPWTMSKTYLYARYRKILLRAELDDSRRSKFHRLRRSHATHLKAAGGDPTMSLGHSSAATTVRYLDPRFLPSRVSDLLPPIGSPQERIQR